MYDPVSISELRPFTGGVDSKLLLANTAGFQLATVTDIPEGVYALGVQLGRTIKVNTDFLQDLPNSQFPIDTPNTDPLIGISGTYAQLDSIPTTDQILGPELLVMVDPGYELQVQGSATQVLKEALSKITTSALRALLQADETPTLYLSAYPNDGASPVSACELYRVSQGNDYGHISPNGGQLIRKVDGCTGLQTYTSEAAALGAGLQIGDVFSVSPGNELGIPSAGGRGIAVITLGGSVATFPGPFVSDSEAATNGVGIFEAYIASAGHVDGFVGNGRGLVVRTR